jgi:epoxide hydrolase-like predicted phosphatase
VIFDLGGVVTTYDPMGFALRIVGEATRAAHVKRLVFGTRAWLALDQGLATEAETEARLIAENPEDAADIHNVFALYKDLLVPIPEGIDVVKRVRQSGMPVYALSNFGPQAWEVVRRRDMYLDLFDGIVISSQEKILKPDPAIFEVLLERYSLEPKRCVFIDDAPANVETARRLGIDGIHFENHRQLRQCLAARGILEWEAGRSRAS